MTPTIALGAILASAALAFVIAPLVRGRRAAPPPDDENPLGLAPPDAAEAMIRRYRDARMACPDCGPRPEAGAVFCSACGRYLPGACAHCGRDVSEMAASWCSACGGALAAP